MASPNPFSDSRPPGAGFREWLLAWTARLASLLAILLGLVVLGGWLAKVPELVTLLPGFPSMKVNTAICFLAGGLALFWAGEGNRKIATPFAAAALVISKWTLLEHLTGRDLGIGEFFLNDWTLGAEAPGRMPLATAAAFALFGTGLLVDLWIARLRRAAGLLTGLSVLLIALLGCMDFLLMTQVSRTSMALHASLGLVGLALGLLLLRAESPFRQLLGADTGAGSMLRRLLPMAVAGPLLLGWVRFSLEHAGLIAGETGILLFAVIFVGTNLGVLLWAAFSLHRLERERLQAAGEAARAQGVLSAIVEGTLDAVYAKDPEGRYLMINAAGARLLGKRPEEVLGKTDLDLLPAEIAEPIMRNDREVMRRGETRRIEEVVNAGADGRMVVSSKGPLLDEQRTVAGLIGISHDVTDLRRALAAVQENEKLLQNILQLLPVGVWITDARGRIICSNPAGHGIWGGGRGGGLDEYKACKGRWVATGQPVGEEEWAAARALHQGESSLNEEIEIETFGGEPRIIYHSAVPIRDAGQRVVGAIIVNQDITELKKAQAQIQHLNERLEQRVRERTAELQRTVKELESFSYTVSHHFRNPLRAIHSYASILLAEHAQALPPKSCQLLERVQTNSQQLGQLVDGMLEYLKLGRLEPRRQPVDLKGLFEKQAGRLSALNPRAVIEIDPLLPPVLGDPDFLALAAGQLLSNALKFTRQRPEPKVWIRGSREGETVTICVQDNGAGFDMQFQEKLFLLFERLHHQEDFEGVGIGLALAARSLERLGGKIWAESDGSSGATFHFSLPAATGF